MINRQLLVPLLLAVALGPTPLPAQSAPQAPSGKALENPALCR
jgi:hypothetical protein